MPQPSLLYANSRVAVLTVKLLSDDKFLRMIESLNISDALKVLYESGYANGAVVEKSSDFEQLLQTEEQNLCNLLKEVTPNQNVTDCLLCVYDFNNAKILMKSKYLRLSEINYLSENGLINSTVLKESILHDNYNDLPTEMAEACSQIDISFSEGNRAPTVIDNLLDLAMIKYRLKKSQLSHIKAIQDFYNASAEISNILMLFRIKKAKLNKSYFEKVYIDETVIEKDALITKELFLNLVEQPDENILKYFSQTSYKSLIEISMEVLKNNTSLVESEIWADNFVKSQLSPSRNESEKIEPLINYFLSKLAEIKNVRLILVGLKNSVDKQLLRERVRDIYA